MIISYLAIGKKEEYINVSQLAQRIGISKSQASKAMKDLLKSGIVVVEKISNSHFYSLKEGHLVDQIRKIIGLDMIMNSAIIDTMLNIDPEIISIILYGSFARGDYDYKSDIDLIVISSSANSKNIGNIGPLEGFDVNIITFTPGSDGMLKKKDRAFHDQVIRDRISLYRSG